MILTKILTIAVLLWAGMVLGISFLESWIKFRAPLLTKPAGLDVGRTVFSAFHKVQCVWLLLTMSLMLPIQRSFNDWILLISVAFILFIQIVWLHPQLKHRIDMLIAGQKPKASSLHSTYVGLEFIKLLLLIVLSVKLV